jgi:hypothetical protein
LIDYLAGFDRSGFADIDLFDTGGAKAAYRAESLTDFEAVLGFMSTEGIPSEFSFGDVPVECAMVLGVLEG